MHKKKFIEKVKSGSNFRRKMENILEKNDWHVANNV